MSDFNPLSLLAAPVTGLFNIFGAKKQSDAIKHAADLQAQGADKTLAFQKEQAAIDQANAEANRHANYDQWASREGRLSSLGELAGLGPRQIPGYVPMGGSVPSVGQAMGATSPTAHPANPQQYFQSLTAGKPPTPQSLLALEPQLAQQGIKVLRNASGVAGKIQLPTGQIVDVIQAAGLGGQNWQWLTGGAPSGHPPIGSVGSYLQPSATPLASASPATPALPPPYAVGSVGSYLRV